MLIGCWSAQYRHVRDLLLQAQDDYTDGVNQSLVYYLALRKAGVPAEMHIYPEGGHAFGLRRSTSAITKWPRLAEDWLRARGVVPDEESQAR